MGYTTILPGNSFRNHWANMFEGTPAKLRIQSAFSFDFEDVESARGLHFLLRTCAALRVGDRVVELDGKKVDDKWYRAIVHSKDDVYLVKIGYPFAHVTVFFVPEKIRLEIARSFPEWGQVKVAQLLRKLKWWGK